MSSNYVTLVNSAIDEAGNSLASFATNGSDFLTTTDAMMNRFKGWVNRAWRTIQQNQFDAQFLEDTALVTVDPGIMFYSQPAIAVIPSQATYNIDIKDVLNDTIVNAAVPIKKTVSLTGIDTDQLVYGYVDLVTTSSSALTLTLKPGGEYFTTPGTATLTKRGVTVGAVLESPTPPVLGFLDVIVGPINTSYGLSTRYSSSVYVTVGGPAGITLYTNDANVVALMQAGTIFNIVPVGQIGNEDTVPTPAFPQISYWIASNSWAVTTNSLVVTITAATRFVHGWKSFDFNEETDQEDFVENIKKIHVETFSLIDPFSAAPSSQYDLKYVPWEIFRESQYDYSGSQPGMPRVITHDNQGRWRLWPAPAQRVTLKFDYSRIPQELINYTDVPKGLPKDYMDLIMWLTVIFYGEFDEQPSIVARATKRYKELLQRFEMEKRQEFHFVPHRMWTP